tara:strand:- start:5378 stop:6529 length:1152 start_codon:yes stop_codon:yes gene_type:complete
MSQVRLGASKTYSVADGVSIRARREKDDWGQFDEDWGFRIHDVPPKFRTELKRENYDLAKKEEHEKKIVLESMPYNVVIEPTNSCNLQCPLCSTGIGAKTREKGILQFENFKKVIDEIKDYVLQLSLQNWGEATLVKDLPKMIKYASDNGIFTRLSTNFSVKYTDVFLKELMLSGLGIMVIDLDGTDQETYEKYRKNGNLDLVLENIKRAVKIKKQNSLEYPTIQSRMLVMKHNEHQIEEFRTISRDMNVDEMELGNIQVNPNTAKHWLPGNQEFVYETYLKERKVTPCHWPWSGMTINWDGGVSPCCVVDDEKSDFGDIFHEGVKGLWNNNYYQSARSVFSKEKNSTQKTICDICKNDTHNPNLFRIGDTFSITSSNDVKVR